MSTPSSAPVFRSSIPDPPDRLIDVHVNVGMTDADAISFGRLDPDTYLQYMRTSGTTAACVFPPLMNRYRAANEEVAAWARRADETLLPFARLGGPRGPRPIRQWWQLRNSLGDLLQSRPPDVDSLDGYAGVKMIPHMSGVPSQDLLREISARQLPVLIHTGTHSPASWIESVLLPDLHTPVILAHLGAYPCDGHALKQAVDLAERIERVYLDTSGAWLAGFLTYAVARVPHKLVFGSDAPLMHPRVAWEHVASAVRDDRTLRRIAYETAASLLPLESPPEPPPETPPDEKTPAR